ncbi:MAG: glycosyltransferase family 4 protein [Opitutaceae bacterium]|nr:glycosyltransferase family 4 protein [Opitutaceae bacterium]
MSARPCIFLTHEFYPRRGGIATFVEEMALAAVGLGHEVEVWAQRAPAGMIEKKQPFQLRRLPVAGSHDLTCQLKLAWQLVKHRRYLRHATVYLVEPGPMLTLMWLQFLRAFRPRRVLLTFHGSEILKFHRNRLIRPLARRLIQHAAGISTLTTYTRDLLLTHFPEARGKIVLTPGAPRHDCAHAEPASAKTTDRLIILTVGRLHPRKGQRETLAALAALPPGLRAQIEYWLVGTDGKGDYEAQLTRAANSAVLTVRFLGDVPDGKLRDLYAQADIFALTSVPYRHSIEGFGLAYLEAAAHGLPTVAHDIGGVNEAVAQNITGLLVPPDQPAELIDAFARLITDAQLRRKLGEAGRAWARRHTWADSAALLFPPQCPDSPL